MLAVPLSSEASTTIRLTIVCAKALGRSDSAARGAIEHKGLFMASSSAHQNNIDVELKIKASIGSLKELIIIFTGLTITASFAVFVTDHLFVIDGERSTASVQLTWRTFNDAVLLFLLVLCVMRFYHGNIMILDRHYLIKAEPSKVRRNLTVDSSAILGMTFGLAFLGLTIDRYFWFILIYFLITSISVAWNWYVDTQNVSSLLTNSIPDSDKGEVVTQRKWMKWNSLTLVMIFAIIIFGTTWNGVAASGGYRLNLAISDWALALIITVCYANSVYDLWANRKEYFPRRFPEATQAGASHAASV